MKVYAQERLHDISCNNLSFSAEDVKERVIGDFQRMRLGISGEEEEDGDLDALRATLGMGL